MQNLIVGEADVLVVDEIGKNNSGTGVDPNITGVLYFWDVRRPKGKAHLFLNLSKNFHGNEHGCGLVTVIT